MKQFDILLNIKGALEWVCGVYADDVNAAICLAIDLVGPSEYVGHKAFVVVDGAWVEE